MRVTDRQPATVTPVDSAGSLVPRPPTDPDDALWHQVPSASLSAGWSQLGEVARAILRNASPPPITGAEVPTPLAALGVAAYVSGLGPLLGRWTEDARISADKATADLLTHHLDHGRGRAATLAVRLAELLDVLAESGITATLLKGTDTAHRYFPEPGTRPRADIDLLVAPHQLDAARAALRAAGYIEFRRTRYANRSEWRHPKAPQTLQSLEIDHADNPWSVDLHAALDRWYFRGLRASFGYPTPDQLARWTFAGRPVFVLAQPLLTAFLALHASYVMRDFRPLRAVELVLVVRQDVANGALRWDALAELLDRTRTARFVYPALELAERWVPGTLDPGLRQQLDRAATPRMRRVVNQVEADGLRLAYRSLDERLMWPQGTAEWLGNLSELIWSADDAMTAGDQLRMYLRRARMLFARRIRIRAASRRQPP